MKRFFILFITLFVVLTISCGSKPQPTENPLANANWQIESFGAAGNQQLIKRDANYADFRASIEFTDTQIEGRVGGCNLISYNYTVQGSKINMKPLSQTAMACSDEVMKQERAI